MRKPLRGIVAHGQTRLTWTHSNPNLTTTGDPMETIIINGIVYEVTGRAENSERVAQETGNRELLSVRRPNGRKTYVAARLPDSPLYGENRGRILCNLTW